MSLFGHVFIHPVSNMSSGLSAFEYVEFFSLLVYLVQEAGVLLEVLLDPRGGELGG